MFLEYRDYEIEEINPTMYLRSGFRWKNFEQKPIPPFSSTYKKLSYCSVFLNLQIQLTYRLKNIIRTFRECFLSLSPNTGIHTAFLLHRSSKDDFKYGVLSGQCYTSPVPLGNTFEHLWILLTQKNSRIIPLMDTDEGQGWWKGIPCHISL